MLRRSSFALLLALIAVPFGARSATFTVTNTSASGPGSLRQAILDANASAGADTIAFNLVSGGLTIVPTNALPVLTDPVTIDGSTQPGYSGVPVIEIVGTNAGNFANGFVIATNNCTIRALAINRFRGDNYYTGDAIQITNGAGSRVEGCYLGIARDGLTRAGNSGAGVRIGHPLYYSTVITSNNIVGGETTASHDLISGNGFGIYIYGSSANSVMGNKIGTDATGTLDVGNTNGGVYLYDSSAAFNLIGGTNASERNLISGNGDDLTFHSADGITLSGASSNLVFGNFIGVDVTGTYAMPNTRHGVNIQYGSANLIGGPATGQSNLISGNLVNGVNLGSFGEGAVAPYSGTPPPLPDGNIVQGNLIGTDISGQLILANQNDGVFIGNMRGNLIGGFAAGERNVISGNANLGVEIISGSTSDNQVAGNFIGISLTGALPFGNTNGGVTVNASYNTIGGTNAGAGNVIANNGSTGVRVGYDIGVAILGNSIYANTNLGIDLGGDGVTLNDPGDGDTGPNDFQNFPVLAKPVNYSTNTVIAGSLNSHTNETYRIELFHDTVKDPSGYGEGKDYLGYVYVTTDGVGNAGFSFTNGVSFPFGDFITATATDTNGNTSEFSLARRVVTSNSVDLVLTMTDSIDPAPRSSSFFYTLTVTNYGPATATSVVVTDSLPAGLSFVSATSSQGSCAQTAGIVTCNVGTLANGAGASLIITVNGTNTGLVANSAYVTANELENEPDDNSVSETTLLGVANVAVLASDSPHPVVAGQTVTYTVITTNLGPDPATVANLSFSMDAGRVITGASVSQGLLSQGGNSFGCSFGTIPANAAAILTVTAIPTVVGTNYNYANTSAAESDPDFSNNSTNPPTVVLAGPGILEYSSDIYSVSENAGFAAISVYRLGGAIGTVTANFATSNLTAIAGSDYTATNGTLTFTNGETLKTFRVAITDDATPECNETLRLRLFNPTGGAVLLLNTNATLHIFDNETTLSGVISGVSLAVTNLPATANGTSYNPSISDDGRYIAYASSANNLAGPDANSSQDIFLYDRNVKSNRLVSVDVFGAAANGYSITPQISADGQRVIFFSTAANLTTNPVPGSSQLFVRTLASGINQLVSANTNGSGAEGYVSSPVSLSTNGTRIAFLSYASDLVPGDGNGFSDVFVRDLSQPTNILVSVNISGTNAANDFSYGPAISADGRYVAFESAASDIATNDTNHRYDIFRRDLATGTTVLVSVNTSGVAGNGYCGSTVAISADGRYVAFESNDTDLAPGTPPFTQQVFRRDLVADTTILISVNNSGVGGNNGCSLGGMSRDGRYVLFGTYSSNLATNDNNFNADIFLRDTVAGTTALVSVDLSGTNTGSAGSGLCALSPDGRYVTFLSSTTNLTTNTKQASYDDVFQRDLLTGVTTLLSTVYGGSNGGNGGANNVAVSAGGVSTFSTYASDLAPLDINGSYDVFARAPGATSTELVSFGAGVTGNENSFNERISADGSTIAFSSSAANLVTNKANYNSDVFVRKPATAATVLVSINAAGTSSGNGYSDNARLSADGRYVAFESSASDLVAGDTNDVTDIFLRDTLAGTTMFVSVNKTGAGPGNNYSYNPNITPDGKFMVFESQASNLVSNDVNGATSDIFIRNRTNSVAELVSVNAAGTGSANSDSYAPTVSDDGRYVAFESYASNFGPADSNNNFDVYVRDRQTGSNILCSPNLAGNNGGNADSFQAKISRNGRVVVFFSYATNLVAGDTNDAGDLFAFDLTTRTLQLVSRNTNGIPGNGASFDASFSADGRYVAFYSQASDLVANDSNGQTGDIFRRDLIAGTTTLVSVTCDGSGSGDYFSSTPHISADGRFVTFESLAWNLAPGVFMPGVENIFRRDLVAGSTVLVSQTLGYSGGGNASSFNAQMSADGSVIAFASAASDLITGDGNGRDDIFVWNTTPVGGYVDLALDKDASTNQVVQSANLIYTLTVTNHGTAAATGVVVTDPLPAAVAYVSASATQGTASTNSSGLVTWTVGSLAVNAGARLSITVTATTAGNVINTASASAVETDFYPGNNSDSVNVQVAPLTAPALSITVTNGNQLFLNWPYPSSGYNLETTTNLAPVTPWSPVSNSVSNNGLMNFVILNVNTNEPMRFYRLFHP